MKSLKWVEVYCETIGSWGCPGQYGGDTVATLWRRGDRWSCDVKSGWGVNQGHRNEVHGSWETEGRGNSAEEAVESCRKDVLALAKDDKERAELATLLRKVAYAAEDAGIDSSEWHTKATTGGKPKSTVVTCVDEDGGIGSSTSCGTITPQDLDMMEDDLA